MCSPGRVWPGPTLSFRAFACLSTLYISLATTPVTANAAPSAWKPALGDLLINRNPVIAIDERLRCASLAALCG